MLYGSVDILLTYMAAIGYSTGTLTDRWAAFLRDTVGDATGHVGDLENIYLAAVVGQPGATADLWLKYLRGRGFTGTVEDMVVAAIAADGLFLGPELVTNTDFDTQTTVGWGTVGVAFSFIPGELGNNSLVITASDGAADRAEYTFTGLDNSSLYRVKVLTKPGQASDQWLRAWTFATISNVWLADDSLTAFTEYDFDITTTATGGIARFYAASAGVAADTLIVDSFSMRKYLS